MSFESPFARYLQTNYVPQPNEISKIKAIVGNHQSILHGLLREEGATSGGKGFGS